MKDLDKYNEDFKKFTKKLIGRMLSPDDTMRTYLHWLNLGLLKALKANGQKQKTLASWQLRAKIVLKRTEKEPEKTRTTPLEQLKKGAKKLPRETHHQILKELALEGLLPTTIRCQVIGELACHSILEGQELAETIHHLNINAMYIPKKHALKINCSMFVGQHRMDQTTLIDSGATENFISQNVVEKLQLKTTRLPQERKIFNVDGTENQAGYIKSFVPLYIQYNGKQRIAKFFVMNLGKEQAILGYPWLEEFNPDINWKDGKLLSTRVTLKTRATIAAEQLGHRLREVAMEETIGKTMTAQKMADSYRTTQTPKTDLPIPKEYQRHTKVFSEEEAKRFPSSREWDHRIPLTKDTPESINQKIFNLPTAGREAIEK